MFLNVLHRQMLIPLVLGAFSKQESMVTDLDVEDKLSVPNPGEMGFDLNVQLCSSSWVAQNLLHRDQTPTWTPLLLPTAAVLKSCITPDVSCRLELILKDLTKVSTVRLWDTGDLNVLNSKAFKYPACALRTSSGYFMHTVGMVVLPVT